MDIGHAVQAMQEGRRVTRAGWNGKDMWLAYQGQTGGAWQPFIYMRTVQGTFVPWLCSQTDLLATDWEVVG